MKEPNVVLAELIAQYRKLGDNYWEVIIPGSSHPSYRVYAGSEEAAFNKLALSSDGVVTHAIPSYDTDYNAMAEVWKVLKERGLWVAFLREWETHMGIHLGWAEGVGLEPDMVYDFLNDLPGQIDAAIKVMKEAKDV